MNFLWKVKKGLKQNKLVRLLNDYEKKAINQYRLKKYSDKEYIDILYKKANNGQQLNWDNPKTFTEKLQWLKLYYRDDRIPICSDKIDVKKYLSDLGYEKYLVPTLAVYNNADEIDFDSLPNQFALKASHGSGWNIICKDKSQLDWKKAKKELSLWLSQNLYMYGREWNYKEQKPRLILEPLISDMPLFDYKFMCFNGKVKLLQLNYEKKNLPYTDFYDENFCIIKDMSSGIRLYSNIQTEKPDNFEQMKKLAEELSSPFPFVRVDLYSKPTEVIFGEMTFFPGSGFWSLSPDEKNIELGNWLKLPDRNC